MRLHARAGGPGVAEQDIVQARYAAIEIVTALQKIAQGGITNIPETVLCASVVVAASSNNLAKAVYAVAFGGTAARRPAALLMLLALLGVAAAAIYVVGL